LKLFSGTEKLKFLNLNNNKISKIDENLLEFFAKLPNLLLGNNECIDKIYQESEFHLERSDFEKCFIDHEATTLMPTTNEFQNNGSKLVPPRNSNDETTTKNHSNFITLHSFQFISLLSIINLLFQQVFIAGGRKFL
jgi:hypothetical protein